MITEIKRLKRLDTTTVFFNESNTTPSDSRSAYTAFKDNGKITVTFVTGDDGLTQTETTIYDSLETYSQVDTFKDISLDSAYFDYRLAHNFDTLERHDQYAQSGIDQPFTCTTTYTFPTGGQHSEILDLLVTMINDSNTDYNKLKDLTVNTDSVVAVHQYNDSVDFTPNHWGDLALVTMLQSVDCTRTIQYDLVSSDV